MDLLERLRLLADPQYFVNGVEHYQEALNDAADEIERLTPARAPQGPVDDSQDAGCECPVCHYYAVDWQCPKCGVSGVSEETLLAKLSESTTPPDTAYERNKVVEAVILRPAVPAITLDEALLSMSTFYNGCDFRLRFEGSRIFLEWGCYGVHVNLAQGPQRALTEWLQEAGRGDRELIPSQIQPETLVALKSRKPCQQCGGFRFRALTPAQTEDKDESGTYPQYLLGTGLGTTHGESLAGR